MLLFQRSRRSVLYLGVFFAVLFLLRTLVRSRSRAAVARYPHGTSTTSGDIEQIRRLLDVLNSRSSDEKEANLALSANIESITALVHCLEANTCGPNQSKVVVLASQYFFDALHGGIGGEHIWAGSVRTAVTSLGYTVFTSMGNPNIAEDILRIYRIVHPWVKILIINPEGSFDCYRLTECIYHPTANPSGIPVWKMFSFNFWTNAIHPLGARWTVSPEPYTISQPNADPNFYLGYSVESSCSQQPFIPPSNRSNQVYILGKWFQFFSGTTSKGWPPEFYDAAAEAAGISFVVGAIKSPWNTTTAIEGPDVKLPKNITNHGLLPQKEFLEVLAHSRMLIGVGDPATSPTPYDALCLGVPFLNPVGTWDRSNPKDKIRWNTQHNPLKLFGPPYVYNVLAGSKSEFIKAIKDAVENPLPERYILERMTISAVKARTATLIETDWRTEAGKLLEEWRRSGRTDLFEI